MKPPMKDVISILLMSFYLSLIYHDAVAQSKKKTIAVLEFNSSSTEIGKNELTTLSNRFRSILVKTDVFTVLERTKMNDILNEQNFVVSDNCNSAECAVQVGQLLGVELMIAGDIGKLGSTYSIDLRMIDVSSGQIVRTETQDHDGRIDGLFSAMAVIGNSFAGIKSNELSDSQTNYHVSNKTPEFSTFTDPRDGNEYKIVRIGNQTWMAENLKYDAEKGSGCYDNRQTNCSKYGKLYSWETANRVAPLGWHVPSKTEWETLLDNLGGLGLPAYQQIIPGGSSGFVALSGGWYNVDGYSSNIGKYAYFWSSSENDSKRAWGCYVDNLSQRTYLIDYSKNSGLSVRYVKD